MRNLVCFAFVVLILLSAHVNAADISKKDSLETLLKNSEESLRPAILNQLCELNRRDPKAFDYATEAIRISRLTRNEKEESIALRYLGISKGFKNDYDGALASLLESLQIAERIKAWSTAGEAALNVGTIYYVIQSNHEKALHYYLEALKHYERDNNKKGIGSALSGLGITYTGEKKFDQALETLNRSLAIFEEINDRKEIPKIHVNIGSVYKEMKDYSMALKYLNKAIDEFADLNNSRGKAHSLYAIGEIYRIQKNYRDAIRVLNEALALNEKSDHKNSMVDCLIELGLTHMEIEQPLKAEQYLLKVIEIASQIHKKESLSTAYQNLSRISEQKGDYQKAYEHLKKHKLYYDSIFSAEKSKQVEEMQTRYETEKKEKEIVVLKQEKALNQIYLFIAAGIIFSVCVISLLFINRQKLKIKIERELSEKENQLNEERNSLLEAEIKNRELSEQQLQNQLEFKNKELASYTLNLIQKNEILHNLKESVDEIRNTPDAQVKQKLNSLASMVNYSFHLDREWENFKMHFEQVHQNFFKRLLELYPDLSANDLKLCSLIKLNLDNRGIAAILNISQESAKVARHRLRKKLDLPAEQTLLAFFSSLENSRAVVPEKYSLVS
jgi:tetratricopeptide (TPR) repeat protein